MKHKTKTKNKIQNKNQKQNTKLKMQKPKSIKVDLPTYEILNNQLPCTI